MNVLVVYYSYEGNTELIANSISKTYGFDCIRIVPKNEMNSKGFMKYVWGGGQVVMNIVPKINDIQVDLNKYDLIIVGSPIWAGTYAPPIRSFLEIPQCHNKKMAFFYTHLGGANLVEERAKLGFNKRNSLISTLSLSEVSKYPEQTKAQAIDWVKNFYLK